MKRSSTAIQESAFTRFRPIIMTSISVIAGNIPLALALEPGSSTRASLGIVVIGGITSSLMLTLVLVPIMYALLAPEHFAPSHGGARRPPAERTVLLATTNGARNVPGPPAATR